MSFDPTPALTAAADSLRAIHDNALSAAVTPLKKQVLTLQTEVAALNAKLEELSRPEPVITRETIEVEPGQVLTLDRPIQAGREGLVVRRRPSVSTRPATIRYGSAGAIRGNGFRDALIDGITFDCTDTANPANAIELNDGQGLLVLNSTFLRVNSALLLRRITGLDVIDCRQPNTGQMVEYFIWGEDVTEGLVQGCLTTDSMKQAATRWPRFKNLRIQNNHFRDLLRTRENVGKSTGRFESGTGALIRGNTFEGAGCGIGPLLGDNADDKYADAAHTEFARDVVFEGNRLIGGHLEFNVGMERCVIRRNTIEGIDKALNIRGSDINPHRFIGDVLVEENTFGISAVKGTGISYWGGRTPRGLRFVRNRVEGPNLITGSRGSYLAFLLLPDLTGTEWDGNVYGPVAGSDWVRGARHYLHAEGDGKNGGPRLPAEWNALPQVNGRDVFE